MSRNQPIHRARALRRRASLPEQRAWKVLRKLRHHGFPVRRQMPLAGFTVDFAIHRARLVIEIDGPIHEDEITRAKDSLRDIEIANRGWSVLRIPAETAMDADALWTLMLKQLSLN